MIYHNTLELKAFLQKHQLWNKKSLGQNFLVNLSVLDKIIEAAAITKEDEIVEVGPGLGILTEKLAEKAHSVTTIEYDSRLIPILQESLKSFKNIELILNDALKHPLPSEPYKLVANIPYYITSPLLNHFLQPQTKEQKRPSLIVLLVQKEVAEKICARDGDQSVLSLQVQIFGQPKIISIVNKNSFFPQPKVDSAILKIEMHQDPLVTNIELFFKLIKSAFGQRRKTLSNSLQNRLQLSKEQTLVILKNAQIEGSLRPQMLTIPQWQKLIDAYELFERSCAI